MPVVATNALTITRKILPLGAAILAGCLAGILPGAEPLSPATVAPGTNLPLRTISPGVFELGKVRLDKNARTVTLPAVVNLLDVNIEYLLVTATGKTHESLLRTDAEPYHVQLALLLLGAKGAGTNSLPEDPAQALPGDKLTIDIRHRTGAHTNLWPAEQLVLDVKSNSPPPAGPWIFTGSRLREDGFAAQLDGSIISLITDPDALINNPRPGREDDDRWKPHVRKLPPVGESVEVILRLSR